MMQLGKGMSEKLILDLMSNLVEALMCHGLFRATMINMGTNLSSRKYTMNVGKLMNHAHEVHKVIVIIVVMNKSFEIATLGVKISINFCKIPLNVNN